MNFAMDRSDSRILSQNDRTLRFWTVRREVLESVLKQEGMARSGHPLPLVHLTRSRP